MSKSEIYPGFTDAEVLKILEDRYGDRYPEARGIAPDGVEVPEMPAWVRPDPRKKDENPRQLSFLANSLPKGDRD